MAATVYYRQGLIGTDPTDLSQTDGGVLSDGDAAFVFDGTNFYCYRLDASSGAAESSPDVIEPDTSPGSARWIMQDIQNVDNSTDTGIVTAHTTGGTHTFNTDANWAMVVVTGSGGTGQASGTGGGAAGGTAIKTMAIPAATSTITVGASVTASNTAGASSSYADGTNTISATGGGNSTGIGGIGSGGDTNIRGGSGTGAPSTAGLRGAGGASYWGGGSSGVTTAAGAYGSGGGAKNSSTLSYSGGGIVYIVEYK